MVGEEEKELSPQSLKNVLLKNRGKKKMAEERVIERRPKRKKKGE